MDMHESKYTGGGYAAPTAALSPRPGRKWLKSSGSGSSNNRQTEEAPRAARSTPPPPQCCFADCPAGSARCRETRPHLGRIHNLAHVRNVLRTLVVHAANAIAEQQHRQRAPGPPSNRGRFHLANIQQHAIHKPSRLHQEPAPRALQLFCRGPLAEHQPECNRAQPRNRGQPGCNLPVACGENGSSEVGLHPRGPSSENNAAAASPLARLAVTWVQSARSSSLWELVRCGNPESASSLSGFRAFRSCSTASNPAIRRQMTYTLGCIRQAIPACGRLFAEVFSWFRTKA